MDIKFSKDEGDRPQQGVGEEKGKQNFLLVFLLILAAGVGYVYFFTGLIKPSGEQKTAAATAVTQVIRKPLPPLDGSPAKSASSGIEAKKEAPAIAKPEPVKAAPVAASAVKPVVPEAAKPVEAVKKAETPQSSVKKPLPAAVKTGEFKVVAAEKKQPAVEVKRSQSPQDGEKKLADAKKAGEKGGIPAVVPSPKRTVRKEPAPAGDAAGSAQWTVLVGNYVLEEALATDLASVRKAGLHAYVVSGPLKKSHMSRLLLAEFPERAAAQAELVKLKRYTSDAFILDSAGKHTVFAGSYLLDARAATEIERLAAVGFSLTMKRVEVAIPSKNLTAGSYADQNQAEDTIKKLRAAGIKATLSH